jgi:hypothetical protein
MEVIFAILFFPVLIGVGIFLIKYSRTLTAIVDQSNVAGVDIFGARYKNVYHIMGDVGFLNSLWVRGCYKKISEPKLSELVARAHRMLRAGILISMLVFFIPLVIAVVRIGG